MLLVSTVNFFVTGCKSVRAVILQRGARMHTKHFSILFLKGGTNCERNHQDYTHNTAGAETVSQVHCFPKTCFLISPFKMPKNSNMRYLAIHRKIIS